MPQTQPKAKQRTLKRLRRDLAALPEPEAVTPLITTPAASVPAHRPAPPPGGWPDDAGWNEAADEHFAHAGEEPQT